MLGATAVIWALAVSVAELYTEAENGVTFILAEPPEVVIEALNTFSVVWYSCNALATLTLILFVVVSTLIIWPSVLEVTPTKLFPTANPAAVLTVTMKS